MGKGAEEARGVPLTDFVEFENQNKQSFQCEDIGDKFPSYEWTWDLYCSDCVCMSVCRRSVKQNAAVRPASVICFKTN